MVRPTFLVLDVDVPEGISTRKLILETAKHNVLTAYSGREAIEILDTFPNLDAAVVHAGVQDLPCQEVVRQMKSKHPEIPVVALTPLENVACEPADYTLSSHNPQQLLVLLEKLIKERQGRASGG